MPSSRPSRGPAQAPAGTCTRSADCDTATLQIKYDVTTLSSLYSKCLDVVTVLSLAADDTSVGYGASIDFTSVLKVATNTAYGRLSANSYRRTDDPAPASGHRLVDLDERRDAGVDEPDRHVLGTIHVYATADYRTVFSTPTNEGLHGDTSPTVSRDRGRARCNCPEP